MQDRLFSENEISSPAFLLRRSQVGLLLSLLLTSLSFLSGNTQNQEAQKPSLILDSRGNLIFVYRNELGQTIVEREKTEEKLHSLQTLSLPLNACSPLIKKDNSGKIWLIWEERMPWQSQLFRGQVGAEDLISLQTIGLPQGFNFSADLGFDEQNAPWVAWIHYQDGKFSLLVEQVVAGQIWKINSPSLTSVSSPRLIIDKTNSVWVFWSGTEGKERGLFYRTYDHGQWSDQEKIPQENNFPSITPEVALGDGGRIWLAWSGYDGEDYEIFCSCWDGTSWNIQKITENQRESDLFPSLSLAFNSIPVVAWQQSGPEGSQILLAFLGNHTWSESIQLSSDGTQNQFPRIFVVGEKLGAAWLSDGEVMTRSLSLLELGNKQEIHPYLSFAKVSTQATLDEYKFTLFGDSITLGEPNPGTSYNYFLRDLLNQNFAPHTVINSGRGGEYTADGLARINSILEANLSRYLLLMYGINDIKDTAVTMDTAAFNLKEMLIKCLNFGTYPSISSVIMSPWRYEDQLMRDRLTDLNQQIKQMEQGLSVSYVDQFTAFKDYPASDGGWESLLLDWTHPSEKGYQFMAETWFDDIKTFPSFHRTYIPDVPGGASSLKRNETAVSTTGGSSCTKSHGIEYRFDWGDGTYSSWSSTASATHAWTTAGDYTVKAQARCAVDNTVVSGWSGGKAVTVSPDLTISGTVSTAASLSKAKIAASLKDVVLMGLPGNPSTDASGKYTATIQVGWSGTVTPVKADYAFTPSARAYSNLTADQTDQNYTATPAKTPIISGSIKTAEGQGVEGVLLAFSNGGGTAGTNSSGNYSYSVGTGWSGTVTPSKPGYAFSPSSRTYTNVTADQAGQNFTATLTTYTVSGTVNTATTAGTRAIQAGLKDVVLYGFPGNPATDSSGNYTATVPYGWSGTVTPLKANYIFSPSSRTYSTITSGQAAQDYTATPGATPLISGSVKTADGKGVEGVLLTFSNGGGTAGTNSSGDYTYSVGLGWSGTVTPSKTGYTFTPSSRTYSNLISNTTRQDFTASLVTYTISGTVTIAGTSGEVKSQAEFLSGVVLSGFPGNPVTDASGKYSATVPYSWTGAVTPIKSGYSFSPPNRSYNGINSNLNNQDYIASATSPPSLSLSKTRLTFGATTAGKTTSSQKFQVINTGGGTLDWSVSAQLSGAASGSTPSSATNSVGWLSYSPSSSAGDGVVTVSANPSGLTPGTYPAKLSISSSSAANSPQFLPVTFHVLSPQDDEPPFGHFSTPQDGSTEVSGEIPVTGWALDDIEVSRVEVKREPVGEDPPAVIGGDGLVYIGDAVFVRGARPDVEQAFPSYPLNDRAGWGYMMLTLSLPNRGNGTFVIYAFAVDVSGNRKELGHKKIVCDNASRKKPFGTIDTPRQGEAISGKAYLNFGWALTPPPKLIPKDGSTIWVYIDGVLTGQPVYNQHREDLATLFPGYLNSSGAAGYLYLDTTQLSDGLHNISWYVEDEAGESDGIGSRYFEIQNNTNASAGAGIGVKGIKYLEDTSGRLRISVDGEEELKIEELERVEIRLRDEGGASYLGWGENFLQGLPAGSTLDSKNGVFYWSPGPGFVGKYVLHFAVTDGLRRSPAVKIVIRILPKKFGQKFNEPKRTSQK